MTQGERREMYRAFLISEGFEPNEDSDGDLWFKYQGGNYLIGVSETDEQFFQIGYPGFWPIESSDELTNATLAAMVATGVTKVAKVYVWKDAKNVSAAIEMFCAPPEAFKPVFGRSLGALQSAVKSFTDVMESSAE